MFPEAAKPMTMAAYRGPSLFQPHHTRDALRDAHTGKTAPLMGLYLGLSSIPIARWIAPMGFDVVWIDWEHSSCNVETMTTLVHEITFMSEGATIPFVRVPGHDHAAIGYALDAGASIIIPQVETIAQAQHVVSAAKYGVAANGTRSAPPFRFLPGITDTPAYAGKTLHQSLNHQAAIMIQIETLAGIKNLDAILTEVPHIDAVWLGMIDARVSMDLPHNGGLGGTEQEWLDAVDIYEATMAKHKTVAKAGFAMGTPEQVKRMAKQKAFVIVAADVLALMEMGQAITGVRGILAEEKERLVGEKKANGVLVVGNGELSENINGTA